MPATEDPCYSSQTVEDETMLLALRLAGEGMTNAEISHGLWAVLAYFADCEADKNEREGIACLLEGLAEDLRREDPIDTEAKPWMQPQAKASEANMRLALQAKDEGRSTD